MHIDDTYPTKFIPFELFGLTTPESTFVHQVRQFLLHELFDFGNGLFQPGLGCAGHVEVEGRILRDFSTSRRDGGWTDGLTAAVAILLSG